MYFMENKTDFCSNPIIKSIYTADPAPMVYGDTLYLYTTHDEDELVNDFYTMFNWHCYSTKDMVNWTDHGQVFSLNDIEWADDRAWAPQAVERNGKFYLYCPVHKTNGGMAIAVGVFCIVSSMATNSNDEMNRSNLENRIMNEAPVQSEELPVTTDATVEVEATEEVAE